MVISYIDRGDIFMAILVNTSRGEVVDEPVLFQALRSNQIKGAALDVFSKDPMKRLFTIKRN